MRRAISEQEVAQRAAASAKKKERATARQEDKKGGRKADEPAVLSVEESNARIAAEVENMRKFFKRMRDTPSTPMTSKQLDNERQAMFADRSEKLRKAPAIGGRKVFEGSDIGSGGEGAGQTYVSDVARLRRGIIPASGWREDQLPKYGTSDNPKSGGGAPSFWKKGPHRTAVGTGEYVEPSVEAEVLTDLDGETDQYLEDDAVQGEVDDRYAQMAKQAGVPDEQENIINPADVLQKERTQLDEEPLDDALPKQLGHRKQVVVETGMSLGEKDHARRSGVKLPNWFRKQKRESENTYGPHLKVRSKGDKKMSANELDQTRQIIKERDARINAQAEKDEA